MATSSPPTTTPTIFPSTFFTLPAEIRNIIYRLALAKPHDIFPKCAVKRRKQIHKPGCILLTSKNFAREASPFIYGPPAFAFPTLFAGIYFLQRIGPVNAVHITRLRMGTFWYKYAEARVLGYEHKIALGLTSQFLARRCPQLESLTVGNLSTEGPKRDWRVATLEFVKLLVDALPQLAAVCYNARTKNLLLTLPDRPVSSRYTIFDVDEEIKNRKDETKARRSAAGKKANAVNRAKKAAVVIA